MRMPPAATNGIMYDTPVISHWRSLVQGAGVAVDLGGQAALHRGAGGHRLGRELRVGPPLGGDERGLLDEGRAVGDALLDADVDDRLAGEPAGVLDREVVGEDHGVGGGDLGGAERRGAGRALGLDLHDVAGRLGGVLERLGRHVGVRDAGRARGDADEGERARAVVHGGGRGRGRQRPGRQRRARHRHPAVVVAAATGAAAAAGAAFGGSSATCASTMRDDLGLGGGRGQGCLEVLLHQRAGELGQHLHVRVAAALGGRDEEDQGGRAVLGAPVDAVGRAAEDERGLGDRGAAGVRDADAAGQAGRHLALALARRR